MKLLAALLAGGVALCGAAWGQPVESSCYIANQRVPCSNWTGTGIAPGGAAMAQPTVQHPCAIGSDEVPCAPGAVILIDPKSQQTQPMTCYAPGRCYAADALQQEP